MTNTDGGSEEMQQCAVCFEDRSSFVHFPCCGTGGREGRTSTKICPSCMRHIAASTDNICRCPRCRAWIKVNVLEDQISGGTEDSLQNNMPRVTIALANTGKCNLCKQTKDIVMRNANAAYCDACYLGARNPLEYQCMRCHQTQIIPHPMYRYQPAWDEFGTATWACHQGCVDYTCWRIVPNMIARIPFGDQPEQWGDNYIDLARQYVEMANERSRNAPSGSRCTIS
mmetsp:Transcript_9242/g.13884  ORF Transcript_9242/g.13884 Transcript_9242/m.13884 type:complete len:227 (+) Transcript_9242:91-771(+)